MERHNISALIGLIGDLTIRMRHKRVVQRAKLFARAQKQSLVTAYLDHISRQVAGPEDIDPEVMELSDRIKLKDLPDLKDSRYRYLKEKYIHDQGLH